MDYNERIEAPTDPTDTHLRHMPEVLEPGPANANQYAGEQGASSSGADQATRSPKGTAHDNAADEGQAELNHAGIGLDDAHRPQNSYY